MPQWLIAIFARYGYLALFGGVFLESTGIPLPGETVLLAAGFFARHHTLRLAYVIPCAAIAAICGDNLGYWIGRRGGRSLVERRGKYVGLTPKRIAAVETYFRKHGARTIFFARFVSGLRVVAALTAGISRLRWPVFAVYEALGAICWATTIGTLGYLVGQSWLLLHQWVGRAGLLLGAILAAVLLFILLRRERKRIAGFVTEWLPRSVTLHEAWLITMSLVAVGLLGKIIEDVTRHESTRFDITVTAWIGRLSFPAAHGLMAGINALASAPVAAAVTLAAILWYWQRRERKRCAVLAAVAAIALLFEAMFRTVIAPVRPSFMAGEPMNAVAIYGLLAFFIARDRPRARGAAAACVAALALAVGVARVFLQLQWPADVLAGYCAGLFLLLLAMVWMERMEAAEFS